MKGVAYLAKFKVQLQEMENEPMNEAAFVIVVIKLTKSKCEEPCEGRLSSTVPREGWVKFPPLTRQEICNDEKKDNL